MKLCRSAEGRSDDYTHHGCKVSVEEVGEELTLWFQAVSMHVNEQCLYFSHHYLEHRAEDLCVLSHASNVELPGEDGRVVILILHFNEHLGCVS